ncbi:Xaa-Pro peptidase family protein [Paenibacillus sp. UNC499MF]|uniref:M24 family metallopeptidase n=1 Tax=Paenibacillus sp. UNC499MF TaxID=1502751 RepID=UPI00089F99FC|nr:Xaa-Pro peptidase family protein [Paenibacillus sp. UNC499MF]SEG46923.1 Xaa-Pro aminopeptidase [Paenibacillus sp. UNC499MF]
MLYNAQRLQAKLKEHNLAAVIATTKENIRYLTGFEPVVKTLNPYRGQCYAVVTADSPEEVHVVHSVGEIDQILDARSNIGQVVTYGTFYREHPGGGSLPVEEERLKYLSDVQKSQAGPEEALAVLLARLNLTADRVALDEDGITASLFGSIRGRHPQGEFIEGAALLRQVRAVKTQAETDALAYSADCIDYAIGQVIHELREGITEHEIAAVFSTAVAARGGLAVLPMIKAGRHAVGGQRRPSRDIRLQPGDLLWFDCDIVCDGYWADIARVVAYKTLKPEYTKYDALYTGQQEAIRQVRPGMTGGDVFHLTMNAVHEAGFSAYRRHHVGHGIGLEPYELPILAPGSEDVIEEGMVLSIETPYYEFDLGALHVEDPVLVTREECVRLTRADTSQIKIVG